MFHSKRILVLLLVVILSLSGCAAKKKRRSPAGGPEKLYAKALSLLNRGKYQGAMEFFEDVKNYYPESPESLRAEVRVADCHFFLLEYEEAIAIYEEFRKLHPYHEDMPHILFQIGEAHFKQIKSSDRDQTPARKALSNFKYLVENYPPSIFAEAAGKRIPICRRSLAEHELLVGMYYYDKEKYRGAVARFDSVVQDYPDTGLAPKALFYKGKALMELSLRDEAKVAFLEITRQYPDSEYAAKASTILRTEWGRPLS
jgi:outer membrane protein assembly factor BamD